MVMHDSGEDSMYDADSKASDDEDLYHETVSRSTDLRKLRQQQHASTGVVHSHIIRKHASQQPFEINSVASDDEYFTADEAEDDKI